MKTLFIFSLLVAGNTLLYFVFFWLVGDTVGKRFNLQGEILYSLRFTLLAAPLLLMGSFFINWAILRDSGGNDYLLTILLMWLANPMALFIATYLKGQQIDFNAKTIIALALMLAAQLIMRLPK